MNTKFENRLDQVRGDHSLSDILTKMGFEFTQDQNHDLRAVEFLPCPTNECEVNNLASRIGVTQEKLLESLKMVGRLSEAITKNLEQNGEFASYLLILGGSLVRKKVGEVNDIDINIIVNTGRTSELTPYIKTW